MTLDEAGTALHNKYESQTWFQAIGMAAKTNSLHIYCQKKMNKSLSDKIELEGYEGFKIKVFFVGQLRTY